MWDDAFGTRTHIHTHIYNKLWKKNQLKNPEFRKRRPSVSVDKRFTGIVPLHFSGNRWRDTLPSDGIGKTFGGGAIPKERRRGGRKDRDHTTLLSVRCWFRKMFRKFRLHTGLAVSFHLDTLTQPHGCCLMAPSALLINRKAWIGNLGQCTWHCPSFTTTTRHVSLRWRKVCHHISAERNISLCGKKH